MSRGICQSVGVSSRKGEKFPFWTKMVCTKKSLIYRSIYQYINREFGPTKTLQLNFKRALIDSQTCQPKREGGGCTYTSVCNETRDSRKSRNFFGLEVPGLNFRDFRD